NSRGRDYPNLLDWVKRLLDLGVQGITVHPRPDERHVTRADTRSLGAYLSDIPNVEFNIEGYPSPEFMALVLEVGPQQCTLVPDLPGQLTSDHGWDIPASPQLTEILSRLKQAGIRSSLFLDPSPQMAAAVADTGADRIELYTEDYASAFGSERQENVFRAFAETAATARELGLGLNAGHDLNLDNLPRFLEIPGILEVSIGHALVVESMQWGIEDVIRRYLAITGK
ncbi:MAG: pyridoxine 5'-phosphate synthase, partial [Gammaproteobacteria bacterium]